MATERTFGNYVKLTRASNGRHEDCTEGSHEYSPKKIFQKYGNSYIVSVPGRKLKFIVGPHWIGIIVTVCLIMGGTWLNLKMLRRHTEYTQQTVFSFEVFIAIFFVWTNILLFLTATSDPGIIFPSASKAMESAEGFNLSEAEYCEVCSVYQPDSMRVHHCSDCNYCIEGMDHHCPWMVRPLCFNFNLICCL